MCRTWHAEKCHLRGGNNVSIQNQKILMSKMLLNFCNHFSHFPFVLSNFSASNISVLFTSVCHPFYLELSCDPYTEFRCVDGSKCIYAHLRCDTRPDCPDGSDEQDCGKNSCFQFGFYKRRAAAIWCKKFLFMNNWVKWNLWNWLKQIFKLW